MYKTETDTAIWLAIFIIVAVIFAIKYGHENNFGKAFVWLIWDFSGLRFIVGKIFPQDESQKKANPPATITLWVIAVYSAFFGIASGRYENAVDIIESRANAFITQIAVVNPEIRKTAWAEVTEIQQLKCPVKPEILKPSTIISSLIKLQYHEMTIELLIRTVQRFKDNLQGANLEGANLQGANLEGANLQGAKLWGAKLQEANLRSANLKKARHLTSQQLCFTANLENISLDSNLAEQVFLKCGQLLTR